MDNSLDYVSLFINSPLFQRDPITVLSLIFITVCRLAPIVALAPFFGARVLPHPVKMTLCLCLLAMVLPRLMNNQMESLPFNAHVVFLAAKELFIGTVIGFFLGLPFLVVSGSGLLIDHQRGAASLMTNDPTIQNQSSPIGTLYNLSLIMIFFNIGGPFYVIDTIIESFEVLPPDKLLNPLFFNPSSLLEERIMKTLQDFVALMLKLAMPGLLVILMTDTFLGIINRLAPQVQITFLGMGLKSWLALFMVCIGWDAFVGEMGTQTLKFLEEFLKMIHEFGFGGVAPEVPTVGT